MPTRPRRLAAAAAAAVALASAACQSPTDSEGTPSGDLAAARLRWELRRPAAYDLTVARSCFCVPFAVTVSVRGGRVVGARDPATGAAVDPPPQLTVDSLFAFLDDAYRRRAARVTAAFDPDLGYPARSFVDYSERVADEELGYEVRALVVR